MERGCENCRHKRKRDHETPCLRCIRNASDNWELEQPTIEQYGTWIPCSERLPEFAGQMVLATLENIYGPKKGYDIFTSYSTKPFWCCNNPEYDLSVWKVIAWMPLPESYKEEEDGR